MTVIRLTYGVTGRTGDRKVLPFCMDRSLLEKHLAQAEKDVALGERRIIRQREILARTERGGHRALEAVARPALATFEEVQRGNLVDRDHINVELEQGPVE